MRKKWIIILFSIILVVSAAILPNLSFSTEAKGNIDWYEAPNSKSIPNSKDKLLYGSMKKDKSYVAAVARQYEGKETYLIAEAKETDTYISEASVFQAYDQFSAKQDKKVEMAVAYGFMKDSKGKQKPVMLNILDTTPNKDQHEIQSVHPFPFTNTTTAFYTDKDKKEHKLEVLQAGEAIKNQQKVKDVSFYIDGTFVGALENSTDVTIVSSWFAETGVGDEEYVKQSSSAQGKSFVTHQRPYALGYRTVKVNGGQELQWEVYTPEFNGDKSHPKKNVFVAHSFQQGGQLSKVFKSLYVDSKDHVVNNRPPYAVTANSSKVGDDKFIKLPNLAVETKQSQPGNIPIINPIPQPTPHPDPTPPVDEVSTEKRIPVTGVAYSADNKYMANGTLRFTTQKNDVQTVQTDDEGYFVVRLQQGEQYTVSGNGISAVITATGRNNIQITNNAGQIRLGKTLTSGNNKSVLQPSTIHLKQAAEQIATDLSKVTFKGTIGLKAGDVFLLPKTEEYVSGLALKAVKVYSQGNQTIVETSEPKLEEVFSAIKGNTKVKIAPEYFIPAPGVKVQKDTTPSHRIRSMDEIDDVVKIELDDIFPNSSPVTFNGALELDGDFTGYIDWAFELDLVDSWDFRFEGSQILKGEVVGEWGLEEDITERIGNFRIPTEIPGLAIHLPVDVVIGGEGKVGVEVVAGMKEDIGIEYTDARGVRTYPEEKIKPVFNASDLTGTGKVSLGVKLSVLAEEAGLDIAGVSGEGGISGEAKTSIAGPSGVFQCAQIEPAFYAKFLLEAPIIDWESPDLTKEYKFDPFSWGSCVRSITANPSEIEMAPGEVKSFTVTANDGLNSNPNVEVEDDTSYNISNSNIITVQKDKPHNKVNVTAAANAQDGDQETIYITYNAHGQEFKDRISVKIVDKRARGTLVGKVVDAVNGKPLQGATVKIYNGNRLVTDMKTKEDGTYDASLIPTTYKIIVSYPNYITDTSNVTVTAANTTTYDSKLQLVGDEYGGIGNASGTITNALTGQPVSGLNLTIRKGRNNTSGEIVKSLKTNEQGAYAVDLPGGNYTVEISGAGYISTSFNVISIGGLNKEKQNATISPEGLLGEGIRVVLNWGEKPLDLDSHLTGPAADGDRFHVYYRNKDYRDSANEAKLDVDDTTSYGPETVTVVKRVNEGTYTYAIHNYSDRFNLSNNFNISNSEATVRLYSGNVLLATYNVPINKEGNVWRVFEIRNGQIVPINRIDYIAGWENASYFAPQGQ